MMYIFLCTLFRVVMPRWQTALLPLDLLCSPVRIAWEVDNTQQMTTDGHRNYLTESAQWADSVKIWFKYDVAGSKNVDAVLLKRISNDNSINLDFILSI